MKHAAFFKRFLSLLLVLAMIAGNVLPGMALEIGEDETGKTNVSFTRVDNDRVSASLRPNGRTENTVEAEYAATDVVRVSIILEKASTIKAGFSATDIAVNQAAVTYRENLKKDQTTVINRIEKATKSDLDVVWNLTLAANIVSANVQYGQIKTIENLPGVKSVVIENQYLPAKAENGTIAPNMATSGGQIGSGLAWNAGYTGAGTRIAVVDTGTDTDHQSLNAQAFEYALALLAEKAGMSYEDYIESLDLLDAEEIASVADKLNIKDYLDPEQAYFNTKLPFGFNYKDADYDIVHDNDEQGEHGSHVAGIATANSWLYNGEDYVKALDYCFMQGVAPEAQLLTMKVFGKGGSPYDSDYMAAIEDAVILGADVVNLSLGSVAPGRGTHSNPIFQDIMDDLAESGVVVAISAGNSGHWAEMAENGGYLYNTDVSQDTLGQPGSFTNSLCVASVENDGMVGYYLEVGGQMLVYNEDNRDGQFTNKPFREIAGEYEYIYIDGVGKAEDWAAVAEVLPGKIAICSRGETNFVEKATLAIEAGAIAVLIYNNQSGIITLDLTEYQYTNPVAALTQAQGKKLRELSTPVTDEAGNVLYLTGTMTVSNTIGMGQFGSTYYTMSDFSSWGVTGSLELKPEITAPGGNIYSINGLEPSGGGYEIMSGTSMASPQVAGMSALMAQYLRENALVDKTGVDARHLIQSLLMSTATPILAAENQYYPVLQQGAGLANVWAAMNADSYILMAEGTNNGAADGKVKVELFDDPDRTGAYSATFTLYNLYNVEKTVNLNADFFIQSLLSDGTHLYMDLTTAMIAMDVVWSVNGNPIEGVVNGDMDFNGDGRVNTADGQTLLDYATGVVKELTNKEKADVDGDGDIDSHDAYTFLSQLYNTTAVLPAGGSVEITVDFSLTEDMKATLDESYPNGTYIQGFLYAETEDGEEVSGTSHSIPVLGFYGNWTDASMFDVGQWTTYATGEDTRIPYIGRIRGNDFKVVYDWDPGYNYSFGGNPLIPDSVYMPERNAMNAADSMDGVSFIAIRNADQSRVVVVNETTGEVIMDQKTGAVNMAYYYGVLGWQNSGMTLTTNFSQKDTTEGDHISMDFTLVPEYYVDENGDVDWDALGDGATISTSWTIDNTAPELFGVSIDLMNNTMTVKASDNQYIAAVGLYNKTGTRCLAQTGAKQDIAPGEVAEYTFSLDKVNGKKFLLQVFDYAMNRTTYLIEMQIGEEADLPAMMAYDLVSRHWCGFDKDFVYDYKVGTPRVAYADHIFYAATIAEHYAFATTNKGDLYVMPEDDLSDTTFITNLGQIMYDMAYNKADGEIYAVNDKSELFSIHKLTGELTKIGTIGLNTNTLACSPEGVFYCNELGTGKVYSFTLETMDAPELLMEDPFLTYVDPFMGADMGGTTGNMGMEYNPNTDMIAWNSHCEVLIGSYITYAYYYEIDPATGEFTRYEDFWHEMSGLMIPDRTGAGGNWADPTDEVIAVKLNKSEMDIIRGTTAQLTANVMPWTATDRTVTWTSADETIATVDKNGVVTGISAGTTTIRATSNLDPDFYAECVVNVEILEVTIHGTTTDENNNSMFFDWDMSTGESWTAGAALDYTMTSATYSTALDVFYMMDNVSSKWQMHKVTADGTILESAENTNGIALWDMTYNPYFSEKHGEERISGIYYYYLLSPKNPMAMNAVGFNLGDLASYLVGITTMGYEQQTDENGDVYDTEHIVMLDNDGYVWDFWIYDVEGGGMNALYNISKSNLNLEFPGDDTMDNLYTSLMVGDDGNLYLSAFNGTTNEIFHMSYDESIGQYVAVKIGDMGELVYPATITSVTVNGTATANTASPKPMYTMAATEISDEELAAASTKASFSVTDAERDYKLELNDAGDSKTETIELAEGENQMDISKMVYYSYTPDEDGTVTMTVSTSTSKWYAMFYANGADGSYVSLDSTQPEAVEVTAGTQVIIGIRIYESSKWSAVAGTLTINVAFTPVGGSTTDPEDPDPEDPEIPEEPDTNTLVLGTNELVSGTQYTYTVTQEGRLEFDFVLKDSDGKTIYQYAYGKADRVKILINGVHAANLADTKISVSVGDTVTVELESVDGGAYTATLTMSALEAATKLVIGDNDIARNTDYSFIATQDGTLYTTIKELWCDGTYCSEASLSSSVVFKINGKTVSGFENAYEVKTGDEITVLLGTQFGESANAVLNLSYDGYYEHPIGSRGNPYTLTYAECPTTTVEIAAGEAVWYKLYGFGAGYQLTVKGENAYVIVSDTRYDVPAEGLTIPAVSSLQIGNDGTAPATFELMASIEEGYPDNPKDLVEGDNTVTLDQSANYYYDFVAPQAGTATFTVSGDNWRFFYSLIGADGTVLVSEEDHRAARGDSDTVTVELTAGQSIVLKLGTLNSSWTAPGGELTVTFQFTPAEAECLHENTRTEIENEVAADCTTDGSYDEVVYCADCGVEISRQTVPVPAAGHNFENGSCTECGEADPDYQPDLSNALVLGKNDIESGIVYTYVVPADGRMEFAVGSVYNSAGSKQYSWYNGSKLQILVGGKAMTASSAKMNVTAGQIITVEIVSLDGDTFTADITLKELTPAESLVLGNNDLSQNLEYVYVAEQDGTVYVSVVEMLYNGAPVTADALGNSVQMTINGASVSVFEKSYQVKTGDEIAIIIKDYSWSGDGVVSAVINLSYEGFYEHALGSLMNPVELLYADCPTQSVEIPAGTAVWYKLESYYDESAWSDVYPFDGKYLVVTGEGAYIIVDGTRYDAVDGVVKVLMDEETMIQIGNDGASAATFQISVEIPEGAKENPKDLVEGDNKVTLGSYQSYYYDFIATEDGVVTVVVSGENWKYTFEHYGADGAKISGKDYYAKNGDADTQTLEIKAGEKIVVVVGTSKGYSQPGGDITVNFHFEPACRHTNTEIRDAKEATCIEEGYTGDTYCVDCGELIAVGESTGLGDHSYVDGACEHCGEADPDANKVIVNVTVDVDATNGVVLVTWDPANLKLVDIVIHADYQSILQEDGSVTFGYVVLDGIAAGQIIATLTFEAVDPDAANVTIEHKQVNNDSDAPCQHFETEIRDAKDATCTEEGYTGDTYCAQCGELIAEGETIEMLEHNMVDGVCTECGHRDALLGDVNGDGAVDTTDAKLIMQLDLGLVDAADLNLDVADVNGDGVVDTTDAKLIMQKDLGLIEEFPAGG